jgi:hypothetical protein
VVRGTVGIAGVPVSIDSEVQTTDTDGRFTFAPRREGFYVVVPGVSGIGFTPRLIQLALTADARDLVFQQDLLTLSVHFDASTGHSILTARGEPGQTYDIQGTKDLESWERIGTATADASGSLLFKHDPRPATRWFYRLATP